MSPEEEAAERDQRYIIRVAGAGIGAVLVAVVFFNGSARSSSQPNEERDSAPVQTSADIGTIPDVDISEVPDDDPFVTSRTVAVGGAAAYLGGTLAVAHLIMAAKRRRHMRRLERQVVAGRNDEDLHENDEEFFDIVVANGLHKVIKF